MLKRELVMTIPQFNAVQRGELTYDEIRKAQKYICNNTRVRRALVVGLAVQGILTQNAFAEGLDTIEKAGKKLLSTAQFVGYWACLIMCLVEIIMALLSHRKNDIKGICIKYIIGFASLYFMPWIFDLIKSLFEGLVL